MAVSFFLSLLVYQYSRKKEFFKTVLVLAGRSAGSQIVVLWRMVFCEQGIINQLGLRTRLDLRPPLLFRCLYSHICGKTPDIRCSCGWRRWEGYRMSFYEAAEVDGAGWLLYITIPQVRKAAGMILFLAVINSLQEVFREAYIVAGSYQTTGVTCSTLFNHWFFKSTDPENVCGGSPFNHCNRYFSDSLCHQGGRR